MRYSKMHIINTVVLPQKPDMFLGILEHDNDFSENEEYWRKDTKELGFKSEAERVSCELSRQFSNQWETSMEKSYARWLQLLEEFVEKVLNYSLESTSFITKGSVYRKTLIPNVQENFDKNEEVLVIVSYVSNR
ncbi:hypothetical protein [Flammeovirga agarivorans]|uniref:Uncharacterized protein n=1 Tax=Flammeovirga agarivorans TaxID=2726742 RepID=A0A7X8SR86_9BACT|nr:hypothetical protein [Flammeovirga agarivorans]NLR94900.1 hypothetical protein [Flammeovirga agarivorans]